MGPGLSGCREVQNPTGVWCFFNQKIESPPGSWAFMVSGSVKPHRGLVFFCSKNEIPAGVSDFQSVGKCKTPPGSGVFFYPKNGIPIGVSDIQGVGKCKPHPVVCYLGHSGSQNHTL